MFRVIFLSILLFGSVFSKDQKPITSFEDVSNYLKSYKKLPYNFVTKEEARAKGWDPAAGNLDRVLPKKSIGGDRFGNREGRLPNNKCGNRTQWYEADIDYKGGKRNAKRIVYCIDYKNKLVHVYKSEDHYQTFMEMK